MVVTTDPRAVQHILQQPEMYPRPDIVRRILVNMLGEGVLVAQGDAHRVQRKTLSPAFGPAQLRALTGIMLDKTNEVHSPVLPQLRCSSERRAASRRVVCATR
jgi:cytochrome P450